MPGREVAAHFFASLALIASAVAKRVGPGGLTDGQAAGRLAVIVGLDIVLLGAQLRSSHIRDPDHRPVGLTRSRDGGKFFRGLEQALDDNGGIQALAFHGRRPAELSGGDLHVVSRSAATTSAIVK